MRLSGRKFTVFLTLVYGLISLVGILNHEIWMDEAHHWLLARDSVDLSDLWRNTRYEGHPLLWNFLLYIISRFTGDPVYMQLLNCVISISAAYIFVRYSPFAKYQKILFCFGYFIIYEYAVISRNYSLLILALFLSIHLYINHRFLAWAIMTAILANTHLFGLAVAVCFAFVYVVEDKHSMFKRLFSKEMVIVMLGALVCIIQIYPPGDSPFLPHPEVIFSHVTIEKILAVQIRGFFPIPDFRSNHLWNTNLFTGVSAVLSGLLSVMIGVVVFLMVLRERRAFILYSGSFVLITSVIIMLYPASVVQATRHYGLMYVIFVVSVWLTAVSAKRKMIVSDAFASQTIGVLFFLQSISGFIMFYNDFTRPFSESKNVVNYISGSNLSNFPVATFFAPIPSVSAYLQNKVLVMPSGKWESYYKWQELDSGGFTLTESQVLSELSKMDQDFILIAHDSISIGESEKIKLLKQFTKGIVAKENFYLYRVNSTRGAVMPGSVRINRIMAE